MYEITRTDGDIDLVLQAAHEQNAEGASKWPGMTYEEGVAATIEWITGSDPETPMDG